METASLQSPREHPGQCLAMCATGSCARVLEPSAFLSARFFLMDLMDFLDELLCDDVSDMASLTRRKRRRAAHHQATPVLVTGL